MKKIIFSVLLLSMAFPTFSQTSTSPSIPGSPGPSSTTTPSGAGFGGALGGADSTVAPTNVPTNTLPRNDSFGSGTNAIQTDQMRIQEQQANPTGTGTINASPSSLDTTPSNDSTLPRSISPSPTTPASGVGTGTPTSPR